MRLVLFTNYLKYILKILNINLLYGADGKMIVSIQMKKRYDRRHECFANRKDNYIVDKFVHVV
jgi:hypothetical protein